MLLQEALKALECGQNVRREAWPESDGYLALMPGMTHVWKIMLVPNPNAGNYIFSLADLKADDWKLFHVNVEEEVKCDLEECDTEHSVEL